jgi:hypothetical protein
MNCKFTSKKNYKLDKFYLKTWAMKKQLMRSRKYMIKTLNRKRNKWLEIKELKSSTKKKWLNDLELSFLFVLYTCTVYSNLIFLLNYF